MSAGSDVGNTRMLTTETSGERSVSVLLNWFKGPYRTAPATAVPCANESGSDIVLIDSVSSSSTNPDNAG